MSCDQGGGGVLKFLSNEVANLMCLPDLGSKNTLDLLYNGCLS